MMINQLQIFADEYGVKREDLRGRCFGSLLISEQNQEFIVGMVVTGMFMIVTGTDAVFVIPFNV